MGNKEDVRKIFLELGADVCGFAPKERFAQAPEGFAPCDVFPECETVIVFGRALPKGVFRTQPRIIYGRFNYFCAETNDTLAFEASRRLEHGFGCACMPLPADTPYEYWETETLTGHGTISMKHAAVLAGLGTMGKSTLLLSPQYGNRLILGAVLTDLKLEGDPLCADLCRKGCRRCIDGCPAHAIRDNGTVDQFLCRNNAYGRTARGFETVDCNLCRVNCPMAGIK